MNDLNRREFLAYAAALGASVAWGTAQRANSRIAWSERRELYPQGVASGDPQSDSVILWTRRPFADGKDSASLTVEVAEDPVSTASSRRRRIGQRRSGLDVPRAGRRG